jgi:replicative DNA helicase
MPAPETDEEDFDVEPAPEPPVHYAEQALLGALLLDPGQLARTEALLPEHFRSPAHRAVYAAMCTLTPPELEVHRKEPVWVNAVLARAVEEAPGVSAAYLHTCIGACLRPQHAASYAEMVRADHARRTLRVHAVRLEQAATDTTLPDPVTAVAEQAAAIGQFVDQLANRFTSRTARLPRTPVPAPPPPEMSEEVVEEERLFLATATAQPNVIKELTLRPEDFAVPLHGQLYQCLTGLAHRGEDIDPITVLWEAQHRGLLTWDAGPNNVLTLFSQPAGSPEHWAEQILRRALLFGARRTAARIRTVAEDQANTTHQLVTGTRRALAALSALRTRRQRHQHPHAQIPTRSADRAHTPTAGACVTPRAYPTVGSRNRSPGP